MLFNFFKRNSNKEVKTEEFKLEGENYIYLRANRWASRKIKFTHQKWQTSCPRYGSYFVVKMDVTEMPQERCCTGFLIGLTRKEHQRALNKAKLVRRLTYKQLEALERAV